MRFTVLVLLSAACGPPPRPRPAPVWRSPCALGTPVHLAAKRVVPGYPVARRVLSSAELAARTAKLASTLPGWRIELWPSGDVAQIETIDPVGAAERPISAARVERIHAALVALGAIDAQARPTIDGGTVQYLAAGMPYLGSQPPAPADASQVVLRVQLPDAPPLPAGATVMTDDELHALWGPGWRAREAQASTLTDGHPCDPAVGHPHACDGAGPSSSTECVSLAQLALTRTTISGPEGTRFVIVVGENHMPSGPGSLSAAVPLCVDAVTGEELSIERCVRTW